MAKGLIHSVETMGAVDGPGLRYVLFMKGCPLRCAFCHNPDTWANAGGEEKTAREVADDVLKYGAFFRASGGGFTASGGEPLLQPEFLRELFSILKAEGIHTAIDTCGYVENISAVEKLVELTDLFLLDIKHLDAEVHGELTGKPNFKVLKFLEYLSEKRKEIHIRIVLLEPFSTGIGYAERLADFFKNYPTITRIDLLPYHTLGVSKWKALNLPYKLGDSAVPSKETCEKIAAVFKSRGFNVTVQ